MSDALLSVILTLALFSVVLDGPRGIIIWLMTQAFLRSIRSPTRLTLGPVGDTISNELSRLRTELLKLSIISFSSPHPVQPNRQRCHLRNALFPTHRPMKVPTAPIRSRTHRRLCCLHRQEPQQSAALLMYPNC
jgi:hypothetical protein